MKKNKKHNTKNKTGPLLLVVAMFIFMPSVGQTKSATIKVFAMDSKETENTLDTLGEEIITLKHHPKTIENLSHGEIKMLKKLALKNNANAVSIDLKRLWTNHDLHKKNEYYVLYLKNK